MGYAYLPKVREQDATHWRRRVLDMKILARASGYNWARFMHLLDKAYPKQYQEQDLFDDIDFEEV